MEDCIPTVDLVVLSRDDGRLAWEVERGIRQQQAVRLVVHRVQGIAEAGDENRCVTIARARNAGKSRGSAPWLMFLDDDVHLDAACVSTLVEELSSRPAFAALAADYLGERSANRIARHVAMGATLFRRPALDTLEFAARGDKCECQCCCDDLRERQWGIDYSSAARARHLVGCDSRRHDPQQDLGGSSSVAAKDPTVCLLVCHFGEWPAWIDRFLLSCAYNPTIDWLIFSDQPAPGGVPANVRIREFSSGEFQRLVNDKLGLDIQLSQPRKVCDYKPLYGHLFERELTDYDYWGYTDLDVIFGDLRRQLTAARLQSFDVLTARREYLVGHFTLWRNTTPIRHLYRQSADLGAILYSPQVVSFDECGWQHRARLEGERLPTPAVCDSITHVVERLVSKGRILSCRMSGVAESPELNGPDWRLRWQAGQLWQIDRGREVLYCHFHMFKNAAGFATPMPTPSPKAFEISADGFHDEVPRTSSASRLASQSRGR